MICLLLTPLPQFWRSHIVRLFPKHILVNLCSAPLLYKQQGVPSSSSLEPGAQIPFHVHAKAETNLLIKKALPSEWSAPIGLDAIGLFQVKCDPLDGTSVSGGVYFNVELKMVESTHYMIVRDAEATPLFKVRC